MSRRGCTTRVNGPLREAISSRETFRTPRFPNSIGSSASAARSRPRNREEGCSSCKRPLPSPPAILPASSGCVEACRMHPSCRPVGMDRLPTVRTWVAGERIAIDLHPAGEEDRRMRAPRASVSCERANERGRDFISTASCRDRRIEMRGVPIERASESWEHAELDLLSRAIIFAPFRTLPEARTQTMEGCVSVDGKKSQKSRQDREARWSGKWSALPSFLVAIETNVPFPHPASQ